LRRTLHVMNVYRYALKFGQLMKTKNKIKLNKTCSFIKVINKAVCAQANLIATFYSILFLFIILFHFLHKYIILIDITNIYCIFVSIDIFLLAVYMSMKRTTMQPGQLPKTIFNVLHIITPVENVKY
jgi:hypothetical protein